MNNYKDGLHLSVDATGRVSLWDTSHAALRGKDDHEITVHMKLTPDQKALLMSAAAGARRQVRKR